MKLPPLVFNKIVKFFLFVILEIVCVALILNNSIVQQYKIMEGIRIFNSFFWTKSNNIKTYTRLRTINKNLIEENQRLLEQNTNLKEFISKAQGEDRLDKVLSIIDNTQDSSLLKYDFILAKVIKNTLNSQHNYLIIDKGLNDGVSEDLGVITPSGAIGITRGVGNNHSYVLSFLNEKQSISAKIGESDIFGTLKWDGKDIETATLTEIPLNIKVKKDDIVFTSGNSSFFPSNIPIGKTVGYTISNGTHKNVIVKLLQDFRDLDYVIVVRNKAKKEIDSLSSIKPIGGV